ncbi:hypothetical protein RJT34_20190 [Clitoria ternatea]|uniref:Uncharacterized protein n=1 Tax=Clitoria ternatea TaxID=43366 RepID=A0AAN9ISE6_CLITE
MKFFIDKDYDSSMEHLQNYSFEDKHGVKATKANKLKAYGKEDVENKPTKSLGSTILVQTGQCVSSRLDHSCALHGDAYKLFDDML